MLPTFSKRGFALYSYRAVTNSRIFFDVSKGGSSLGQLEFELYDNRSPVLAQNFTNYLTKQHESGLDL